MTYLTKKQATQALVSYYEEQQMAMLNYEGIRGWKLEDLELMFSYYEDQADRYMGELFLIEVEFILGILE